MTKAITTTRSKTYEIVSAYNIYSATRAKLFLQLLGEIGRVPEAAQLAGFKNTNPLYYRKKTDQEFAIAWAEAIERAGDRFEAEAVRRAITGVEEDVYYQGEIVGQKTNYSDGLLAKLLDGSKPDKYQRKRDAAAPTINVRVGLAVVPMTNPGLEDWEKGSIELHQGLTQVVDATATPVAPEPLPSTALKVVRT
jgi:hypothetical protein